MTTAILILGSDASLVSRRVDAVLEELALPATGVVNKPDLNVDLTAVSLLEPEQVLIIRDPDTAALKTLTAYLKSPLEDRTLVITSTKPQAVFRKAVTAAGGKVIEATGKTSKDTVLGLLSDSSLDRAAKETVVEHVGDNVSVVPSLLKDLRDFYGDAIITRSDVEPWLGAAGQIPVWSLIDAIDTQNTVKALKVLDRIWTTTSAIAVVSILRGHLEKMYRVQQTGVKDEKTAAVLLGLKGSTYPAKKAITLASRYKSAVEPLVLLASQTDAGLRGGKGSGVPDRLAVEILIGRMCTYPRR